MLIRELLISEDAELHVWARHRVRVQEVDEVAYQAGLIIRGRSRGLYLVLGRTEAGRYLTVLVRYLGKGVAALITGRDMDHSERKRYQRAMMH